MKNEKILLTALALLSAGLMSIPYLIPHMGVFSLFGLVPLLCAERVATIEGTGKFWRWHYLCFLVWNLLTTFWVCKATFWGGLFASFANALQMSLVFGLFRLSKKSFSGALPYIFLAATWIAWEKFYLTSAQISWPWLVLGNSFARTTSLVQWYDCLGTLGGSAWVWACNLAIFGLMVSLSNGSWFRWNAKAKVAAIFFSAAALFGPMVWSAVKYFTYEESSDALEVAIVQPNFDPYEKFEAYSQDSQNAIFEGMAREALQGRLHAGDSASSPLLLIAPETFTADVIVNDIEGSSKTFRRLARLAADYPGTNVLFGASDREYHPSGKAPSRTAVKIGERWVTHHNSSIITDSTFRSEIYHKSKLVVGVEMTPYPSVFVPVDKLLGGVMGRDEGQGEPSALTVKTYGKDAKNIPVGTPICYESVYGDFCRGYIKAGAQALVVMTNDAWWGDTPGYKQHFSYSRLRAIETRRDIARCANTGISGIIDQRGEVVAQTGWWVPATLRGHINLNTKETVFVREGDITGRLCRFVAILLFFALVARLAEEKKTSGDDR